VVFSTYGIDFDDIDVFYLAGGFGRHIGVEAAKRIGLVPNLPSAKIVQAGNTAIEGATIALLSKAKRQELEELVKRVQHCRLETHPDFFNFFVEGCQFKPVEPMPCLSVSDAIELACAFSSLDVQEEEYVRLLGFPRGWVLEVDRANWPAGRGTGTRNMASPGCTHGRPSNLRLPATRSLLTECGFRSQPAQQHAAGCRGA